MNEDPLLEILAGVAPGTPLRDALDNILRARTGALIIIGGEPAIDEDCDGAFPLDVPFQHQLVYELAKMDGAILLDRHLERIRRANVEMIPKKYAPSHETGMRHRTAERIAQTRDATVIAVSQRRQVVTLYRGQMRYMLHDLSYILTKATNALASLGRYDRLFRSATRRLGEAEQEGLATLGEVAEVMRRGYIALKIRREIKRYVVELGRDGHLIDLQLEEYPDIYWEWLWLWRDYQREANGPPPPWEEAESWNTTAWGIALGFDSLGQPLSPRGYRWLYHLQLLPGPVIDRLGSHFASRQALAEATAEELSLVGGIDHDTGYQLWMALHSGLGKTDA
ncbi:MAG: DNA integrity scanning protein DisA [Sulfobacillus thermosulfidooxidans]|nr:MAG: DNA integrity scanning protein DisA [Sulfobacillus thermosulfidooxidans]